VAPTNTLDEHCFNTVPQFIIDAQLVFANESNFADTVPAPYMLKTRSENPRKIDTGQYNILCVDKWNNQSLASTCTVLLIVL